MSWTSRPRRVAGIMTGTSLDGIDVAICRIEDGSPERIVLDAFATIPYDEAMLDRINQALTEPIAATDVLHLNIELAHAYAAAVHQLADPTTLDLIGMHGQTIWHEPPTGSWQAGSATTLATMLGVPVVADMRSSDIALGGQGAPLVPLFDHTVLADEHVHVAAVNIGGMANVTSLPPASPIDRVMAFDTGPGNVMIDLAARMLFGKKRDDHGAMARAGRVIERLLLEVQGHPYMSMAPPKSTGREVFSEAYMSDLIRRYGHGSIPSEDVLATVTEFTAWSIAHHIEHYLPDARRVVVSGGGVHNTFLMERLAERLAPRDVTSTDACGVPADAKEAMCWAFLAWRSMAGRHGNVPSVTGATRSAVLGSVALPAEGWIVDRP